MPIEQKRPGLAGIKKLEKQDEKHRVRVST
jgi:hypothetical protein